MTRHILQVTVENSRMWLVLFALLLLIPCTLCDNVSHRLGLKIFRDEYKRVAGTCIDLGFAKKPCNSDTGKMFLKQPM